jgi:hypothetical protein
MAENVGVFVSHHHSPKEDAATTRLVADLQAAGADVWVDTVGVSSGSFVQKINEGLSGRQWLVLVMTNAALRSQWVQNEVNAALHQVTIGRMRGVIPFMMTRCDEAHIPPLWAPLHRYDATKDYEAARDGLLRAIGLSLPTAMGNDLARQKALDELLALSPQKFEEAVPSILTANGYTEVQRLKGWQGADLDCIAPNGRRMYVLCKRYLPGHLVRQEVVLHALGAGANGKGHPIQAMIVTTSGYTPRALALAQGHSDQIQLIDGQQLAEMMQRVQPQ